MNLTRRSLLGLASLVGVDLASCRRGKKVPEQPAEPEGNPSAPEPPAEEPVPDYSEFEQLALDMDAWSYDEVADCYYQLAVPYCLTPASSLYESLALFVPGAYFMGTKHGSNYHCEIAPDAQVGEFTPKTAPIALPINTPSCAAQECPTAYAPDGLARYLQAGMVYVYAGFRGRSGGYESTTQEYFVGGAPWPLADLKAALRFLRYNADVLPCDTAQVYVFGKGAGGGLGAALGCGGNLSVFDPYLQEIGAVTHDLKGAPIGDGVSGVALWCPLGSFNAADAAYEWMMGQYASEGTRAQGTWTNLLSRDLAQAYASYINNLGLADAQGNALELDQIDDGSYTGGSYYDHMVGLVAEAAADFFSHATFPYTILPSDGAERFFPGNPAMETLQELDAEATQSQSGGIAGVRQVQATIYDNLESYIASLNSNGRWLTYNASRGEADVTGLWGFVGTCRPASHDVCAYDSLDRSGLANQLFGTGDYPSLHFDALASALIGEGAEHYAKAEGWDDAMVSEWRGDLAERDLHDRTVEERVLMTDPLTLLAADLASDAWPGGNDADAAEGDLASPEAQEAPQHAVASHWRINTGLFQSKTTLAGEFNLACSLAAHKDVEDVSFEPVWAAGYELAERSGDPEDNLVAWICACAAAAAPATGQNGDDATATQEDQAEENS